MISYNLNTLHTQFFIESVDGFWKAICCFDHFYWKCLVVQVFEICFFDVFDAPFVTKSNAFTHSDGCADEKYLTNTQFRTKFLKLERSEGHSKAHS